MIRYKKASKQDLPLLIEYELQTMIPHIDSNSEKLKTILLVNQRLTDTYQDYVIIYSFLKPVGMYLLKERTLKTIYISKENIGEKVLKKLDNFIDECIIDDQKEETIKLLESLGYQVKEVRKNNIILRKD